MRKLLGAVVLVGGVAGLGWYASQGPAVSIETRIAEAASAVAGGAIHDVTAAVSGRDITVSGTVNDAAEQDALLAAFDAIPGRRVVNAADIVTLPAASPFFFSLAKTDGGVVASGNAPSAAIAADLGYDGLAIASGAPADWAAAVAVVRDAIAPLDQANVIIADANIAVTGTAATPAELGAFNTALESLPAGFAATSDIAVTDDGTPLRLTLAFDGTSLTGSGKIPADQVRADLIPQGLDTELDIQDGAVPSADGLWPGVAQAAVSALLGLESGDLALEAQSGTLTGVATPDGIATAQSLLSGLPDGYVIETALTLFDDGAPFALSVDKTADGLTASGKVPADFVAPDGLTGVDTAFITDGTGLWPGIAQAGLSALDALETGTLDITDGTITLTGTAAGPAQREAVTAALSGYDATSEIDLTDDGLPLSLTLTYSAETGASLSGKLPAGISPADVAAALDLEVADAGASQATLTAATDFLAPLAALQRFLPELSGLTFIAREAETTLQATTIPGVDPAAIAAEMQAALGADAAVDVRTRTDLPAPGTTRINRFSGREEVFTAGYWLPSFDFFPTPENCAEQSDIILSTDKVQFVTGSADLDTQSIRAINALSALARKCALEGGVFLQVAGHTDNVGDAAANLALSEARANAVRDAILARGLARVVVSAAGFGDTQPIADNDTEDGRAANRRTEFNWNFE